MMKMNRNGAMYKIWLHVGLVFFLIISSSISLAQSDMVLKNETDRERFSVSLEAFNLSINGMVFQDLNQDHFIQNEEAGLSNWTISLIDSRSGAVLFNTTSDEKGSYSFNNLLPGSYTVIEELIIGWKQTAPGAGKYEVVLTTKDAFNLNFGNINASTSAPAREELGVMYFTPEQIREFQEHYNTSPKSTLIPEITEVLTSPTAPTSLSLLPYLSYVPSERNQGVCGDCWVWGGTGAMEIDRAVRKGTKERLSIQWLNSAYNGGSGSWACCGGWQYQFADFYKRSNPPWTLALPWTNSNAQFQDGGRRCEDGSTSVLESDISQNPFYGIYRITQETVPTTGIGKDTAIANIKNVLNQKKAVVFSFFVPTEAAGDDFQNNFWYAKPESEVYNIDKFCGQTYSKGWGHATLIVGYDDITRTWLVLNSWGTAYGIRPNGLFRISMDMNYDCQYPGLSGLGGSQAFYFETHGIVSMGDGVGIFRPSTKKHYLDFNNDGAAEKIVGFGLTEDIPISIQRSWSTTYTNGIGVYRPSTTKFYLDYDLNGVADKIVPFGLNGDIPVSGSWGPSWNDGVGVYRPSTKKFYLDYDLNSVVDKIVPFGLTGDIPLSGDWNGDWYDGIGVYRPSTKKFYLDNNLDGVADRIIPYGLTGDKPVSGDWNGDRKDGVGVYRPSTKKFYLDNNLDGVADRIFSYGLDGDKAVISSRG